MSPIREREECEALPRADEAARKRAAVETFVRHEATLQRTARRYSLCADDADDALQRGLEILLTKAPTEDPRELIRWIQTVVKHEALAVRRDRERILAGPAAAAREGGEDLRVTLIPSEAAGPADRAERSDAIARSREALKALKPQELRALSLLAEGYSYAEIGEITGYSQTKINRCLAEGRERFRGLLARSEDGRRCEELRPLLSAFCDGEAGAVETAALREHLRACGSCRATLRAYRAAAPAAAALAPALPLARSLLDRVHEAFAGLSARLGGTTAETALSQAAVGGGSRGTGIAALAKVAAICVGAVGGGAACVAGVVPGPVLLGHHQTKVATIGRHVDPIVETEWSEASGVEYEPAPPPATAVEQPVRQEPEPAPQPTESPAPEASTGAVEYAPEPAPAPVTEAPVASSSSSAASGSPAGEFGP